MTGDSTANPADDWRPTPPSWAAMSVMSLLLGRGGCMRMEALLPACGLSHADLAAALNELNERTWIDIVWRSERARRREALPERFRDVRRVVTTRCGRTFYPRYWVY